MTKKDFLLKLLNSFKNWDLASSIYILIENDELDNKKIEAIYNIFLSAMKQDKNNTKLKKSLNMIKKLKDQEEEENIIDQNLAEDLLKQIK